MPMDIVWRSCDRVNMVNTSYASAPAGVSEAALCSEEDLFHLRSAGQLSCAGLRPRLIDAFAGAGGMTAGFTRFLGHVYEPVWANDYNQTAVDTYSANFGPHCICGDIEGILSDRNVVVPEADVVIGGPPCQGFSLLNKKRDGDPRRGMWLPFLEIVRRSGASVFVMENVPQILGSPEHDEIVTAAGAAGFRTTAAKLCAADYGVPQSRLRAFIVGCSFCDPALFFPPKRTHYPRGYTPSLAFGDEVGCYVRAPRPWRTVRDAIGDLPAPVGTEIRDMPPPLDLHFGRSPTAKSRARYEAIPEEGMNRVDLLRRAPELTPECWKRKKSGGTDLFGRLWWDRPAFTIRTEFYKPEKGRYLHPEQHRPITHREAARLQSFPDAFVFRGSKIEIARQIGNAVPPVLAARVADCVLAMLASRRGPGQ